MTPYIKGKTTKQAHVGIPEGLCEEEVGREGFFGAYAHLYRTEPPVDWIRIEGELKPHCYDTCKLSHTKDWLERRPLLKNNDVKIYFGHLSTAMPYFFRNADGDELLFVHTGKGKIETDYGPLNYRIGDYLVIPRGTVYRIHPDQESTFLTVESFSAYTLPDKGMLGQHALFDPAIIDVPEPDQSFKDQSSTKEFELKIKRMDKLTSVFYPFYPINTVGWKGTLHPWRINVDDIRPIMSERYHLPPSAHTTFLAKNFVVCSFLPRSLETGDPECLKVPFYHSNIDYDEVIFYHAGEFFSRGGIEPGMITFHPQGIHHGPHKAAVERSKEATFTNEQAVMIDTRYPLEPCIDANDIEQKDYWKSWKENK